MLGARRTDMERVADRVSIVHSAKYALQLHDRCTMVARLYRMGPHCRKGLISWAAGPDLAVLARAMIWPFLSRLFEGREPKVAANRAHFCPFSNRVVILDEYPAAYTF
jgi:hypothetical protein